jgi:hypothetical protein
MIRVAALIRQGKLCKRCSDKGCKDLGTELEPIEIECPICQGVGCDQCNQGQWKLSGCPNQFCKPVVDLVGLCDLYERGLPPVQGGSLDQAAWFLDAAARLKHEENLLRIESNG